MILLLAIVAAMVFIELKTTQYSGAGVKCQV